MNPADPSLRDPVTGLANRRALLAALRDGVPSGQGALILLDLDGFRRDSEGFSRTRVGSLLQEVGQRLLTAAGPEATVYRYAADAFAILLPGGADRDRASAVAEALRITIEAQPFRLPAEGKRPAASLPLTASGAAASYPLDGRTPALLIETLEVALLVAKRTGRNRIAVAGRLDPVALAEIGVFRGLPCPVFVGRVQEQSQLRQAALDVRHVGPSAALVTGEPGSGKSRLLRELATWARTERFVGITAVAQEPRVGLPYSVLAEAVENLLVMDPASVRPALGRLSPVQRAALSVVVRDLPGAGALPEIALSDYGKEVFEAFGALLDELAKSGPLFVAIDEVEFADRPSFDALRAALARRVPVFLMMVTERESVALGRTPSGEFLESPSVPVLRVPISTMTPEEIEKMLRAVLPEAEIPPGAVRALVEASRGSPLYLEETLRSLLLKGRIRPVARAWTVPELEPQDLPRDVEEAIRSVQEALPTRANLLLTRAAVVGTQVDPELLQEVLGQDEMETLDLLDEARRMRVLVASETGVDLLSFPAAHARRIRLASSGETERREIHGRVGVVQEARYGGDAAHLAGEIAYHYDRGGRGDRAGHFEAIARRHAALLSPPQAQGSRRARLRPAKEPLLPKAQEHAMAMMRHFAGALRVGRLYPQWSQVATGFVDQLRGSLSGLLGSAPSVTIGFGPSGTTLNGSPCDAAVAADFGALLDDRLIESLTMLRTFDVARLDVLLKSFMEPFDRARAAPDHWDRFLDKTGLEAIDLIQKAYQAREGDRRTMAPSDKPVPPEEMSALRDVIRFLKAAVDNLRLYPPGHPLVEETEAQAARSMREFLDRVPALTLGTAQGELVVNGLPGDPKFFGDAGQFLVREIDSRELKSVALWRGIAEDEVRALASFFSMQGAADPAFLEHFKHVSFGSRLYERADEGAEIQKLAPPAKPIRSEIRAREFLAQPYDQFLSRDLDRQFPVIVEVLAMGSGRPLAEQLVERLGEHFHDVELKHRRKAYDLLARSLAFASPTTRRVEASRSGPALKRRLLEDREVRYFRAAADVMTFWVPAAATAGCLKELADIAGPALRMRADDKGGDSEISAASEATLQMIPTSVAFPTLLASVRRPSADDRQSAVRVLLAVGGAAVGKLVEILLEEPEVASRRGIALPMSMAAPQVAAELARAMSGNAPPERLVRALEVADLLLCPSLASFLADLVEKGAPEVRREVLRAAEKWPAEGAVPIVRRLLASAREELQDAGLDLAARMKLKEVSSDVARILEGAEDEAVMALCSCYFAAVPNSMVVPLLVRIAARRPKLFGLVRGYAAETRAAAALALSRQGTKQAEEAAQEALDDPKVKALVGTPRF
jgi:diguanylate cyclase (GGDEF)-like protein